MAGALTATIGGVLGPPVQTMRRYLLLLIVLTLPACESLDRLFRNSPMGGEASADRVNLWPAYYENGESIAVLWPIFDSDENGFALRPLVTKDYEHWEVLPPVAWWDAESGDWVVLPAYSFENASGVFPIAGFGDFNYVGPVWWMPGDEEGGEGAAGGLFPLVDIGHGFNNIGTVFWGYDKNGEMDYFVAFPFYGYGEGEDGAVRYLTPLGGMGVDAEGETDFLNVLGPVYHYNRNDSGESRTVLWPIYNDFTGENRDMWSVWPAVQHETWRDDDGELTGWESNYLSGLVEFGGQENVESMRIAPLFAYSSEKGRGGDLLDLFTLYKHDDKGKNGKVMHVGTPLLFNYRERGEDRQSWNSLLGTIQYSENAKASEFRLLWYLYRQRSTETETTRDLFPFVSWDSGEERSRFSFLWRLFNWERNGDKTGGHVLFIPWGDPGGE